MLLNIVYQRGSGSLEGFSQAHKYEAGLVLASFKLADDTSSQAHKTLLLVASSLPFRSTVQ